MRALPWVLAIPIAFAACGKSEGASTPEAAYAGARKAYEARDWESYLRWYVPESRAPFVGLAQYTATIASLGKPDLVRKLNEIETRHGLDSLASNASGSSGDPLTRVKDPPELYADLVRFCEEHSRDGAPVLPLADLTGLTVSGDDAGGQTTDSKGKTWPVKLVRREGIWRLAR